MRVTWNKNKMNRTIRTLCLCLGPLSLLAQPASTLNLTHDLVAKGVATSNMQPDSPKLDSRPLLEAAVAYAQSINIAPLIPAPAAYHFLSRRNPPPHTLLPAVSRSTIPSQTPHLYF